VVVGSIPRFVAQILGATTFSTLAKPSSGVQLITVDEMFYWLMNRALCLQFCDASSSHLLPHQFSVVVKTQHEGWKHIKVDQNQQIKVPFESPFLMYLKLAWNWPYVTFIPKIQFFPNCFWGHHVKYHLKGLPWNKIKKIDIFNVFMNFGKYFKGYMFDVMEHKS
jgi:hypothetical protein